MRAKWRIVVSCTAVFATNKLGSTYHSFSHYDNDRKALETAGKAQRDVAWSESDWLRHARAVPMRQIHDRSSWPRGIANFSKSPRRDYHRGPLVPHRGWRLRFERRHKISEQWWLRILKDRHSRRYDNSAVCFSV